jgi:two-component system, chemotaxis family, CheB/CheR fusion protein
MNTENADRLPESPTTVDEAVHERDEPGGGAAFPIVGVGASAGGLEAFIQLLTALPADTGMAFVLVQHLAPSHASALAEILSRATKMPVLEVQEESEVEPNHVYVIPPGRNMIIAEGKLQLLPREGRGAPHPVDQFFRALAEDRRHRAIGVVLSGTATDGTIGLETIKGEGGITFAQDDTAQQPGMPHSAIASGCVDFVLPPAEIARELTRVAHHPYANPLPEARAKQVDKPDLAPVLQLLHHATGVDFSHYKFNTLYRRITRRMVFQKMERLSEYVQFLRQTPAEVEALYQDALISVTSFFRDPESFEALKAEVFPRLVKDKSRHEPVRVWTLGCSTGQEAYSLAMTFVEAAEAAGSTAPLQIFASDLNAVGIETARAGIYSKDIAQDVSPERLRRFFTEVDGHYRVAKSIRDACVFSRHNVLADPPFSRIDLISCRNLLIYLEPVLQQKILPTLHYALKSPGFLWLGGSETIGTYRNLFEAEDAKHKIYVKKPGSGPGHGHFPLQHGGTPRSPFLSIGARPSDGADLHREADRLLSARFAPPGVLVSADLDILQYRGDTGPYLAPAPGKASLNLLKMLREGLLVAVRAAVLRAGKEGTTVREEGLRVRSNGGYHEAAIEVIPIKGHEGKEGAFLILFEEPGSAQGVATPPRAPEPPAADVDAARLAQELAATRAYLQAVIEQQEAANEELQSANEEVQSANEELQSTNEELETSKEEIQSSNEELATVNDELNNRNQEANRINNDLLNLIGSIQTAIVMLGPDLRVRRFTPAAEKLLNLIPTDIGRPLGDLKLHLDGLPDLEPLLLEVLETVTAREREIRDKHGHWYSLRLRPYRTVDNRIDGVVLLLVDVDAMKRAQQYTESIVKTVREPVLVLDKDLRVKTVSRAFCETFGVTPEQTENRLLYDLGNRQWDIPGLRHLLEEVLPRDNQVTDFEVHHRFEGIGTRTMRLNARRLIQAADQPPLILLAVEDVSERVRLGQELRTSEEFSRTVLESSPDCVKVLDGEGRLLTMNATGMCLLEIDDFSAFRGKEWGTLWPQDSRERIAAAIAAAKDGRTDRFQAFSPTAKGTPKWWDVMVAPVRSGDGRIDRIVSVSRDITATMQVELALRETEERFRMLADNMSQLAWTCDQIGNVTWYNRRWLDYTGLSFEEMQGWNWSKVQHPQHLDRVVAGVKHSAESGEPWDDTFPLRGKDGAYRWFLSRAVPLRDSEGNVVRWFGTNTDVTEQRQMADELRQNAADMAESDGRKNEFLAMLAHELRNPLAPIQNALQILRRTGGNGETVASASEMMERQVHQMVRLVDDLLDVNRISRGKIELRRGRTDLASVVHHAVDAARSLYKSMDHDLTVTLPPKPIYLNADPTRLTQVVGNLLNNACKFTDNGGRISLTVERQAEEAVIRVRDTGIGLAADQLSRIFDMFTQVDTSLERSVSGLGIGLTLVKSLVELHGGTVEVSSAGPGQGSEFVVRLPITAATHEAPPNSTTTEPTTPAVPRRVLVVDDNRDSATSLAMLLKITGNEVRTAADGLEAVAQAEAYRPEVILLDIGLPKMNGYDACRAIRQQSWGKDVLLIALTGWGQEEDRQKSKDAGFNGHLVSRWSSRICRHSSPQSTRQDTEVSRAKSRRTSTSSV